MSPFVLVLILVSLFAFVAGQLLLKVAMDDDGKNGEGGPTADPERPRHRAAFFCGGIVCMTVTFFVNLGLLQKLDLSFLFPFQGLSVIIVTLGASFFLKERLTVSLVVGALLITAGVMLVSAS